MVAEDALRKMGPMAVSHFVEQLAQKVVHEHQDEIREALLSYLRDRAWAEPIVRQAILAAVREHVAGMFTLADGGDHA